MNLQRLKQHEQGLHRLQPGPLATYYGFQFCVFRAFLSVYKNGSWILVLPLELFSFCLSSLMLTAGICFYLLQFVVLYQYPLKACFFYNEKKKKNKSIWTTRDWKKWKLEINHNLSIICGKIMFSMKLKRKKQVVVTVQWSGVLVVITEEMSSLPATPTVAHKHL